MPSGGVSHTRAQKSNQGADDVRKRHGGFRGREGMLEGHGRAVDARVGTCENSTVPVTQRTLPEKRRHHYCVCLCVQLPTSPWPYIQIPCLGGATGPFAAIVWLAQAYSPKYSTSLRSVAWCTHLTISLKIFILNISMSSDDKLMISFDHQILVTNAMS